MSDMAGGPLRYVDQDMKNRRGFVATNRVCHGEVLAAIPEAVLEQASTPITRQVEVV